MNDNLALLESLERAESRRRRKAGAVAWGSVGLAALVMAVLIVTSYRHLREVRRAADGEAARVTDLQKQREALQGEIAALREEKQHYRTLAGVKVVFYRPEDSQLVQAAFDKLGLKVELRPGVKKIWKRADTLAYGPQVSEADCKAVAAALVTAGFPLRRIAPATKIKDARLLQIYASVQTDSTAPTFTLDRLKQEAVCR